MGFQAMAITIKPLALEKILSLSSKTFEKPLRTPKARNRLLGAFDREDQEQDPRGRFRVLNRHLDA